MPLGHRGPGAAEPVGRPGQLRDRAGPRVGQQHVAGQFGAGDRERHRGVVGRPARHRQPDVGDAARHGQRHVAQPLPAGQVMQGQLRGAVVVARDQDQRPVRGGPAGQVGVLGADQPVPPARVEPVAGHAGELAAQVGSHQQRAAVGQPAQYAVHGRRVGRGHFGDRFRAGRPGQVHQQHLLGVGQGGGGGGQREPPPVGRQRGLGERPLAQAQGPLGAGGQVPDDRVEGHAVATVGEVADPARRDVGQRVDVRRVAHQRHQVIQARGQARGVGVERQQRELVPLVAAVVVGHDHCALAGHVPAGARAGQCGQLLPGAVRGDLDELQGAALVAAGQGPALVVGVEGAVHADAQQAFQISPHGRTLSHTTGAAPERRRVG